MREWYISAALLAVLLTPITFAAYSAGADGACNNADCTAGAGTICGVMICGLCYDCSSVSDGICPDTYDISGGKCSLTPGNDNCDPDCHPGNPTFCNPSSPENTPATCNYNGVDEDLDGFRDYTSDDKAPSGVVSCAPGDSCYLCTQAECTRVTGISLPMWPSASISKPTSPLYNPSIDYVDGTALSPGTGGNLRLDFSAGASNAWCTVCNTAAGYSWNGGSCVASETALSNGCGNSWDDDANGLADLNDASCNSCAFADVRMRVGYAEGATGSPVSPAPDGTAYVDITGQVFGIANRRYSSSAGAGSTCAAIDCEPGFIYSGGATCTQDPTCKAGAACVSNAGCGASSCGLVCEAGSCIGGATAILTRSPAGATPIYVSDAVTYTVTSSNPGITTLYELDADGDSTYEVRQATPITHTIAYASNGPRTATARITWRAGTRPVVTQISPVVSTSFTVLRLPTATLTAANGWMKNGRGTDTLTLRGTVDPSFATAQFEIDTNADVSVYESSATQPASDVYNAITATKSPPGTYTYSGRITDGNGRAAVATTNIAVTPNLRPVIQSFTASATEIWNGTRITFTINISDDDPGLNWTLDPGDAKAIYVSGIISSRRIDTTQVHVYDLPVGITAPGAVPRTAKLTVTDADNDFQSATTAVTVRGLPCVTGTQTGNATYDNRPDQCCGYPAPSDPTIQSCAQLAPGASGDWWSCFATVACYPSDNRICGYNGTVSSPPPSPQADWADRDTHPLNCEQASATCTMHNWTDQTWFNFTSPVCCGDDANENAPTWSFPAGAEACCTYSNYCFTNVGAAPGCYAGIENTRALCSDGNDNDCDGLIDDADQPDCGARITGKVGLLDQSGAVSYDSGALVLMQTGMNDTTDAFGDYDINRIPISAPVPKVYEVYASKLGFTVDKQTVTLYPTDVVNVDFNLRVRRCNADCTNDQGYCDRSCVGVGLCQPDAEALKVINACHPTGSAFGLPAGTEVILDENLTSQEQLVGVCCGVPPTGAPATWRSSPAAVARDNLNIDKIDTLVKFTRLITLNGKTYQLVISTW
jgi:hypothetical protein